jgi:uncharacterized repeat protein (TIGR03803 family)
MVRLTRLIPALAAAALLFTAPASASTFKVQHSFCSADQCSDGRIPSGTLLMDSAKNLFGTTSLGGAHDGGTVFELLFQPSSGKYHYKVLYNFCVQANCEDGRAPSDSKLIMDTSGNIYGTTSDGGTAQNGTIFRLVPNGAKTRYTLQTLYNFCERLSGCEDGSIPSGGLTYAGAASGVLYDGTSALYGSTEGGGRHADGTVYSFTPTAHSGQWVQRVLYFFCTRQNCADGRKPEGGVAVDKNGNLIGTTAFGGNNDNGVVFKLVPTTKGHWAESALYTFCAAEGCADGAVPLTGVIIDGAGTIWGTTSNGGIVVAGQCAQGCGTIFKITPNGTESLAYSFCSQADCADGGVPSGLVMNGAGTIYGATGTGGTGQHGTIFSFADSALAALYSVTCRRGVTCRSGAMPTGELVLNAAGDLFGLYQNGGRNNEGGTVFQFTP